MKYLITLMVVALLGLIVWVPFRAITSERDRGIALARECGLYPGDIVYAVLDKTPGMVTWANNGWLRIRFAANANRTDTHVLREDGVVSREPYAEIYMACYEVAKAP